MSNEARTFCHWILYNELPSGSIYECDALLVQVMLQLQENCQDVIAKLQKG